MSMKGPVSQRKHLAMGGCLNNPDKMVMKGYAKGGSVTVGVKAPVGGGAMVPKVNVNGGKRLSPVTIAKRNNGIKGI